VLRRPDDFGLKNAAHAGVRLARARAKQAPIFLSRSGALMN
jgi:hypothetical protein